MSAGMGRTGPPVSRSRSAGSARVLAVPPRRRIADDRARRRWLTEVMDEGHFSLLKEELGPLAARLLEIPDDLIGRALELELAEGTVVADSGEDIPCIFFDGLHRAERAIAGRLSRDRGRQASLARHGPGQGTALGGAEDRAYSGARPGRCSAGGDLLEGFRHQPRARRRQSDDQASRACRAVSKHQGANEMNKADMADRQVARTGMSKVAAREAVDSVFATIG